MTLKFPRTQFSNKNYAGRLARHMYITAPNLDGDSPEPPFDFNPRELYASGETGLILSPNVLSSLYGTHEAQSPIVAPDSPVGLALSQLRDPISVIPNEPRAGSASALEELTVDGLDFHAVGSNGGSIVYPLPEIYPTGSVLKVAFDAISLTGSSTSMTLTNSDVGGGTWGSNRVFVVNGRNEHMLVSNGAIRNYLQLWVSTGLPIDLEVNNFEMTHYIGIHASQAVAGNRPTLRRSGEGINYLDRGETAALNAALPGGTYTVATVDDAGQVSILEGVAVSGSENVLKGVRVGGVIYINRALSDSEKSNVTRWFQTVT